MLTTCAASAQKNTFNAHVLIIINQKKIFHTEFWFITALRLLIVIQPLVVNN